MARYTHDLSETTEAGGLFFNTAIPNIATTLTDVPGQVFVTQLTTHDQQPDAERVLVPVLLERDHVGVRRQRPGTRARPTASRSRSCSPRTARA